MSNHIEWAHANHVQVAGIAEPGEFSNGDNENEVACIVIGDGNGDGMCIEGRPDDLVSLAHRILNAANGVKSDTNASPKLRALYGITHTVLPGEPGFVPPEPSVIHEEMGRQVLDDLYFEPEYDDGSGR